MQKTNIVTEHGVVVQRCPFICFDEEISVLANGRNPIAANILCVKTKILVPWEFWALTDAV